MELSARLDGEPVSVSGALLDAHLAECWACREWLGAAHEVTRRTRLELAAPMPDLAEVVTEAWNTGGALRRAKRAVWASVVRVGLLVVAVGQVAVTFPQLWLGHDGDVSVHPAHELGSLGVAFAVGFLTAALRPRRAAALVPIVGAAALALCATAVADLVLRRTQLGDELPHLVVVIGWLLLVPLAWLDRDRPTDVTPAESRDTLTSPVRQDVAPFLRRPATDQRNAPPGETSAHRRRAVGGAR